VMYFAMDIQMPATVTATVTMCIAYEPEDTFEEPALCVRLMRADRPMPRRGELHIPTPLRRALSPKCSWA
jgi:hypothetical protein